jgi:hypothetical protein
MQLQVPSSDRERNYLLKEFSERKTSDFVKIDFEMAKISTVIWTWNLFAVVYRHKGVKI